ncbi:MAG: RluA family pseudouridine synthase [Acidobacteriia bacterium]|nr:RluA family pseudouridine synthase [Terriglobia bacterium]
MPQSTPQWTIDADDAGVRLDKFLAAAARLGSRGKAVAALDRRKVFLNQREVTIADAGVRLAEGDVVRVWMDRPGSAKRRSAIGEDRDLPIVYEDDTLVVLNKPAGVLAVPLPPTRSRDERSVFEDLESYLGRRGRRRPFVVHRIDRDTSGLVLFSKTAKAQKTLKEQFKRHEPERVYLAIVYGHPAPASGTWRDRMVWDERALIQKETHPRDPKGKDAVCHYRVIEKFAGASLIEVRLLTGRRNQIRLQARLRGHTLVGEQRYVYGPDSLRTIAFPRQALHAHRLTFRHPVDGRAMDFEVPLPEDMAGLAARLRRRIL